MNIVDEATAKNIGVTPKTNEGLQNSKEKAVIIHPWYVEPCIIITIINYYNFIN